MNKRIITLALILAMISMSYPIGATPNWELPEYYYPTYSSWAKEEVEDAFISGLIDSTLTIGGNFKEDITRQQFTELILSYTGLSGINTEELMIYNVKFTDTNSFAVEIMASMGVINGVGNEKFNPNGKITREEVATIIYRTDKVLGKQVYSPVGSFKDRFKVSKWAIDGVDYLEHTKTSRGNGGGDYLPKNNISIEESIVMLNRIMGE